MPDVLVETRGGWLGLRRAAFLDAIHAAIVEALRIPTDDKVLRLIEHPAECFAIPHGAADQFTWLQAIGRAHTEVRQLLNLALGGKPRQRNNCPLSWGTTDALNASMPCPHMTRTSSGSVPLNAVRSSAVR